MKRYLEYNPIKFLADSKGWEQEKEEKNKELESARELSAVNGSGIRSGKKSDPTPEAMLEVQIIEFEIRRLDVYIAAFDALKTQMTDLQKEVMYGFFINRQHNLGKFVSDLATKYATNVRYVYRERRRVLAMTKDVMNRVG